MRKQETQEEHIGLLIASARRRIRQAVGRQVGGYGLTAQQFWVVIAVLEHAGLSLGELAARSRMDEPTASRVVAGLMRRHWLRMETDPDDRRRARLEPARAGMRRSRDLLSLAAEIRRTVGDGLSLAERAVLRKLLRKVIANMDRLHEQARETGSMAVPARRSALRGRRRAAAAAAGAWETR